MKVISDQQSAVKNISPLHSLCWAGDHRRLYQLLVQPKFHRAVDTVDSNEWTPLHWAATGDTRGHIECAQYLVQAACQIDSQNKDGDLALHIAIRRGRTAMVIYKYVPYTYLCNVFYMIVG